jgi:hypothetical protein
MYNNSSEMFLIISSMNKNVDALYFDFDFKAKFIVISLLT